MFNFLKERIWFIKKLCSIMGITTITCFSCWIVKEMASQAESSKKAS